VRKFFAVTHMLQIKLLYIIRKKTCAYVSEVFSLTKFITMRCIL